MNLILLQDLPISNDSANTGREQGIRNAIS